MPRLSRARILIVEPDPAMRRTLSINLRARGYETDTVSTGTGALQRATDRPADLIILALELPDHDGIHIVTELARSSTAPILVTSARDGPHDRTDAHAAGAATFLVKPFGIDALLHEFTQLISPHR